VVPKLSSINSILGTGYLTTDYKTSIGHTQMSASLPVSSSVVSKLPVLVYREEIA